MILLLAVLGIALFGFGIWWTASQRRGSSRWKVGLGAFAFGWALTVLSDVLDGPDPARGFLWHASTVVVAVVVVVGINWLGDRRKDRHGIRLVSEDGRSIYELYGDWTPAQLAEAEADLAAHHGGVLRRETF